MKFKYKIPISTAIAIGVGFVVLLGYFWGTRTNGELNLLGQIRTSFVEIAVVLIGVALLIGIINLVSVHVIKIQKGENEYYSIVLIVSLTLTLLVGVFDLLRTYLFGKTFLQGTLWIFNNIQLPIEMSLMAVMTISLTYALVRLFQRRVTILTGVFAGVIFLLLLGMIPFVVTKVGFLGDLRMWILGVLSVGGARGVLLGVALGTIATGLRVLIGSDRPYGGG
ncbi:MAG: hypothetical protein J7L73_02525 [Anaerolineales bacterium]|nr:hypothetical protein [Anaerolineales bacterium]